MLQAARDHFASRATEPARALADRALGADASGSLRAGALSLLGGITYLTDGFPRAISYLERAYDEVEDDPALRAGIAIDLAFACANIADNANCLEWTARAEAAAAETTETSVLARAAGAAAVLVFLTGGGVDRQRLQAALAGEDADRASPPGRWPSMNAALVLLWAGDLANARAALQEVRHRYDERGIDNGLSQVLARLAEAAMLDGDVETARSLVARSRSGPGWTAGTQRWSWPWPAGYSWRPT